MNRLIRRTIRVSISRLRMGIVQMLKMILLMIHYWTRLRRRYQIGIVFTLAAILFVGLPRLNGGLKLLGFVQSEFVPSTSGAVWETNARILPQYTARIGDVTDPTKAVLSIVFADAAFTIGLTPQSPQVTEQSQTPPVSDDTELPGDPTLSLLRKTRLQLSSVSAQIEEIAQQVTQQETAVASIGSDVAVLTRDLTRDVFGPFEELVQKGTGAIIERRYYLKQTTLIETYDTTTCPVSVYIEAPKGSIQMHDGMIVLADQKGNALMRLEVVLYTNGTDQPVAITSTADSFRIDCGQVQPRYQIRFIYQPVLQQSPSLPEMLSRQIDPQLAQQALFVSGTPRFLAVSGEHRIWWESQTQTVQQAAGDTIETLFALPDATGLSCTQVYCSASDTSMIYTFSPQSSSTPLASASAYVPLSGIATGERTFLTKGTSPKGQLVARTSGGEETMLADDLSSPRLPFIMNGKIGYVADGMLSLPLASERISLPLPAAPSEVTVDAQGMLYALIPYEENTSIILRITPTGNLSVMTGILLPITALAAVSDGLVIAITMPESKSALVEIPYSLIRWRHL